MDDEPGIPAMGEYRQAHTRARSRKIAGADGFVFVSPQYNWGYPAPLKNALDHVYREWRGKPAVIVTYGGHGGGKCSAQLLQVIEGGPIAPEIDFAASADAIRQALAELNAELAAG